MERRIEAGGGYIILALGLRPLEADAEHVVMEMPMSGNVRQGTGVFAADYTVQVCTIDREYSWRGAANEG